MGGYEREFSGGGSEPEPAPFRQPTRREVAEYHARIDADVKRYGALTDAKLAGGLSPEGEAELAAVEERLDHEEREFFAPVRHALQASLDALRDGLRVISSDHARRSKEKRPPTNFEAPNLDGLDAGELEAAGTAFAQLSAYALAASAARKHRLAGRIQEAAADEAEAQRVYDALPRWARW